ncbi:MAG: prolipoprotein diacylglyceryl transferase [Oscillospiraceae bacterium]|nr:prolipoprotein diacylglyceryl transferase [Oscillospiraceae bacterium]
MITIFNDPTITFPLFGEGFSLDIPRFFTIFGFNIYYYGLFITLGYATASFYLIKRGDLFGLKTDNILDLLLITVPCGIVGARIYYMLFNFDSFFAPGQWGNILAFRDGGLAVYGGIIASMLVFIIYSRVKKIPLGNLFDAGGFALLIGQAIGRWGNFVNREAFGAETELPWKMGLTFNTDKMMNGVFYNRGVTYYFHPTFLYESLWCGLGFLLMHIFSKKSHTKYPGQYFLFYVVWYGFGRFMIEGLRMDSLFIPGTDFRASQWLAAISCITAIGLLIYNHFRIRNKTGDIEAVINKYVKEPNDTPKEEKADKS